MKTTDTEFKYYTWFPSTYVPEEDLQKHIDKEDLFFDETNSHFDEEISSFRTCSYIEDVPYQEMTSLALLVETEEEKDERDIIEAKTLASKIQYDKDREKRVENLMARYSIEIPIEEEKEKLKKREELAEERKRKHLLKVCETYARMMKRREAKEAKKREAEEARKKKRKATKKKATKKKATKKNQPKRLRCYKDYIESLSKETPDGEN